MSEVLQHYSPTRPYDVKGEWIRRDVLALVKQPALRVLSLGCGTASTEVTLQKPGTEVYGIDISTDAVAIAKTRITDAAIRNVETDELPAHWPARFDLILCGDLLEHLRYCEHVIGRMRDWLTPDGHLVLSVPNAAHYTVLRELALYRNWQYEDGGLFDRGHFRLFTRKSLIRMLDENGFTVESVTFIRPIPPKLRLVWWLLGPMVWLVPALNDYFVQNWTVRAHRKAEPASSR